MDFKNKVALITGSGRGIGKGIARSFLERGAKVSICDINAELGKQTLQEFQKEFGKNKVIFSKCDVTKDADFEAAYNECEKSLGTVDILVNNAGILHKELRKMHEVNCEGVVRGTELAIKRMGKHNGGKGGYVVNIASIMGLIPFHIYVYFSATKAAAIQFTRIIGGEFHHNYHGVSVMGLCPGGVNTELKEGNYTADTAYNKYVLDSIPDFMNRMLCLEIEDIGEAVVRLINENRSGEIVLMDKPNGYRYVPPTLDNSAMGLVDK